MNKYLLTLLLVILLTACAPKVEIDVAKPVEIISIEDTKEIIKEEDEEIILEEPEVEEKAENIIEIRKDAFYPKEKTIKIDTEIKWVKKDKRNYKIACYLKGNRIILSPELKEGDSFTYTFLKEGEYTCITSPYGLRNVITVEAKEELLSPTGRAIIGESNDIKGCFAAIVLIAIGVLLFFVYRKRGR